MGNRTALVTGCAGFIGSHVVERLLGNGYHVIGLDDLSTGTLENMITFQSNPEFEFVETDIRKENLREYIHGKIDSIFHLAAIASVKISTENPLLVNEVNVKGTLNILELARVADTKRFVLSSSAAVYGNPTNLPVTEDTLLQPLSPYAASKICAESYAHAYGQSYGIEPVILRYFNIYGPRQEFSPYSGVIAIFVNRAVNHQSIQIEGDGFQTRSFLFIDDVAKSTVLAGEKTAASGCIMNISGIDQVSILSLAKMIKNRSTFGDIDIEFVTERIGDVRNSIGSIQKAREVLGFAPSISLEEGLSRTIDWYQSRTV